MPQKPCAMGKLFVSYSSLIGPSVHWQVTIEVDYRAVEPVVSLIESMGFSPVSWFECTEGPMSEEYDTNSLPIAQNFLVQGFIDRQPDQRYLKTQLAILQSIYKIPQPEITTSAVNNNHPSYAPQAPIKRINVFTIYPTQSYKNEQGHYTIPIYLDAAMAFGTGDHPTTELCLKALTLLHKRHQPKYLLDMGCGSGILAIAAAKLWPSTKIDAIDIDPIAISATNGNAKFNKVKLTSYVGKHIYSPHCHNKYDVIIANILANPLKKMAHMFANKLNNNGHIILSGFLTTQTVGVMNAYLSQGFILINQTSCKNWVALILEKKEKIC